MCNATGRDIDAADNISTVETIQETTGHWAEDENSAAASVKFIKPKPSDDSTRFVISKDKVSGESRNIRYGEAFRANSLGHAKNWTLASHITQPRSARKTELVWAHLVGEHGSICLYKADDHGNRDYVRDNDRVYLCLINTNGTNPQGPQVVDSISLNLNLHAEAIWHPSQTEPPPDSEDTFLPFHIRLLDPYEGEFAPGPRS